MVPAMTRIRLSVPIQLTSKLVPNPPSTAPRMRPVLNNGNKRLLWRVSHIRLARPQTTRVISESSTAIPSHRIG